MGILTNHWLFMLFYPIISIFIGVYILKYLLKPKLFISKVFIFNKEKNSDKIYYKIYNRNRFINAIEVKSILQITYTDTFGSRIYTKNLITDQAPLVSIPKNRSKCIDAQGEVFFSSIESSWIRGVPLTRIVQKLAKLKSINSHQPNVELLLRLTYKSGLTGLQYYTNNTFKLHDLKDLKNISTVRSFIIKKLTRQKYFKFGPTSLITKTDEMRNLERKIMDQLNENGKCYLTRKRKARKLINKESRQIIFENKSLKQLN